MDDPRHGFSAQASFIARDPDHETYVFRKFNHLTARNLVHLQSKLTALEAELRSLDAQAWHSRDLQLKLSMRDWEEFEEMAQQPARTEAQVKRVTEDIQNTLKDYHEALLQAHQVTGLPSPTRRVLNLYKQEFGTMKISGHSQSVLDDDEDLVTLASPAAQDPLSVFLRDHWPFPTRELESSYYQQARHFQDKQFLVSLLSLLISSVLLIASIVLLYLITSPNLRLGLVIMFIILFATGVRISTSASRDSIFTATAAYAAVLVVFVSGTLGNTKPD